jgi:poly(rC)-binding protein 2/3/4
MWFRENPPKQVISISPSYNCSAVPFQQYAPQAAGDFIVVFIEGKKKKLYLPTVFQMLIFLCYNHIIFRTTNLAADYVTMEMMVPETMMGGLIGRSGSNISRIRVESGAVIKVSRCPNLYL